MTDRRTSPFQVAFLAIAAALGVATLGTSQWSAENVQYALIGLPVAAASASALAYSGKEALAAIALAVGVAAAAAFNPWSVWFAVPAVIAVLAAIVLIPRVSYLWVGTGLVAVFTVASYGLDTVLARSDGHSLGQVFLSQGKAAGAQIASVTDPKTGANFAKLVVESYQQAVNALPAAYFFAGLLLSVAVVAAIAWSARRVGHPVKVPSFDRVDLPPLLVLGAVAGLLMLGFARVASAGVMWTAIGTNVLLCTSYLLLIQGLAVYSALMKRAHVGVFGRVIAYVVLVVLNVLLSIVTLTGLADMWLNFRRLPREGKPELPLKPAPTHGDDASGV